MFLYSTQYTREVLASTNTVQDKKEKDKTRAQEVRNPKASPNPCYNVRDIDLCAHMASRAPIAPPTLEPLKILTISSLISHTEFGQFNELA